MGLELTRAVGTVGLLLFLLGAATCQNPWRAETGVSRQHHRMARDGCRWEARYRRLHAHPDSVYRWCMAEIPRVYGELDDERRDPARLEQCLAVNRERIESFETCMEADGWRFTGQSEGTWSKSGSTLEDLDAQLPRCGPETGPGALGSFTEAVSGCLTEAGILD